MPIVISHLLPDGFTDVPGGSRGPSSSEHPLAAIWETERNVGHDGTPASSSPSSETSMSELEVSPMATERVEPPPRKIQRLATYRVFTSTDVILDGKVIRHTQNKDSYLKRIELDKDDLC